MPELKTIFQIVLSFWWQGHYGGGTEHGKKDKNFDFKKNKTLNNFKKNQNQIEYFVIILAIIKTSKTNVC